jgi:hypothetical protein
MQARLSAMIPGAGFPAQVLEIGNSSRIKALPEEHADFDLGLIEPAPVRLRVVNGESAPDFAADLATPADPSVICGDACPGCPLPHVWSASGY